MCVGLQVIQSINKKKLDQIECYMCMALLMLTRMEIWIIEDLQMSMCLTYLEDLLVG